MRCNHIQKNALNYTPVHEVLPHSEKKKRAKLHTSNHILDIIGVAGAVNMGIMSVCCLVLDVCSGDGDTACLLFGGLVNVTVVLEESAALLGKY